MMQFEWLRRNKFSVHDTSIEKNKSVSYMHHYIDLVEIGQTFKL